MSDQSRKDTAPAEFTWRKANRCGSSACVEMAVTADEVLVRDSKRVDGPVLAFTREEWRAFTTGVRDGDFDV